MNRAGEVSPSARFFEPRLNGIAAKLSNSLRGHRYGGGGQAFLPAAERPEIHAVLSPGRLARKRRALDCFVSQPGVARAFDGSREAYREAPDHDFVRPAPGGRARYDDWGFSIDSRTWSDQARAALAALDL